MVLPDSYVLWSKHSLLFFIKVQISKICACLKVHFTCNVVMVKYCPWKPTSLHTNCVILLMCLFTSIFEHTVSARVDFVDAVLILMKTWLQLCQLQGWISDGYSTLWERKKKSKNNHNFYKKSNCWTGKKRQFLW